MPFGTGPVILVLALSGLSIASERVQAASALPVPRFSMDWLVEVGRSSLESNLLKSASLEEWTLSVDLHNSRLCAARLGGRESMFIIANPLPRGTLLMPEAGVIVPFVMPPGQELAFLPLRGLTEAFASASEANAPRDANAAWAKTVAYTTPSAAPGRTPAHAFDVNEANGAKQGFYRWRLVRYTVHAESIERALTRCTQAAATAGPGRGTGLSPLYDHGQAPRLLPSAYSQNSAVPPPPPIIERTVAGNAKGAPENLLSRVWGFISAADGPRCPHYPTCSQYCRLAVQKYGALGGTWLTARRLLDEYQDFEATGQYRLVYHYGRWRVFDPVN